MTKGISSPLLRTDYVRNGLHACCTMPRGSGLRDGPKKLFTDRFSSKRREKIRNAAGSPERPVRDWMSGACTGLVKHQKADAGPLRDSITKRFGRPVHLPY